MGERRIKTPYRARRPQAKAQPVPQVFNANFIGCVSAAILFALIASSFIPLGHHAQNDRALAGAASAKDR